MLRKTFTLARDDALTIRSLIECKSIPPPLLLHISALLAFCTGCGTQVVLEDVCTFVNGFSAKLGQVYISLHLLPDDRMTLQWEEVARCNHAEKRKRVQ